MALSKKQRTFIDEYLIDFNATQAAIRAGYSEKSAANIGWENVRKPEIAEAIEKRVAERTMSADEALILLADQARGSMADFVTVDAEGRPAINMLQASLTGKLGLIRKLKTKTRTYIDRSKPNPEPNPDDEDEGDGTLVTEIDMELELYNRQTALDMIAKAHGIYKHTVDHNVRGSLDVTGDDIAQARQRAQTFEDELLGIDAEEGND